MSEWLSTVEAAAVAEVTPTALHNARRAGRLPARRGPDGRWQYEVAVVAAYAEEVADKRRRAEERRRARRAAASERRTVDVEPLLEFIAEHGGPAACGLRDPADLEMLRLARSYGRLTPAGARRLARRCGTTKGALWPSRALRVDAAPVLRQVALRGGPEACGATPTQRRALERAELSGTLLLYQADALAVGLLKMTVWDLWPETYAA